MLWLIKIAEDESGRQQVLFVACPAMEIHDQTKVLKVGQQHPCCWKERRRTCLSTRLGRCHGYWQRRSERQQTREGITWPALLSATPLRDGRAQTRSANSSDVWTFCLRSEGRQRGGGRLGEKQQKQRWRSRSHQRNTNASSAILFLLSFLFFSFFLRVLTRHVPPARFDQVFWSSLL